MALVPVSDASIAEAARIFREGGLAAFPTETVYGLGADATQGPAIARIYEVKGRPRFNPLIIHVQDIEAARRLVQMTEWAAALARAFWPGGLTLVLPQRPGNPVSELATVGLPTMAVRVPSHPVAQALLRAAGCPLAAPSANRSGHVSATTAGHVAADLGTRVPIILDGGPAGHGIESTIVAAEGPGVVLLRPGAVAREAIERVLGGALGAADTGDAQAPVSPGRLASHYAPRARLRLGAASAHAGEALLAFGPAGPRHDGPMINLSERADLIEAAARLFSALRELDATGVASIAVMPIPQQGLGEAINDRLRRAAAPRIS